jgi:hypothetical protein
MRVGKFAKLTAAAGALTLVLAADDAAARTGGGGGRGGVVAARPMVRPITRPIGAHAFRNHRGFFPGAGGFYYGPDGTPMTDIAPSSANTSSDVRYTYTYDVPWDWAHRYPPNVVPSDRPYVSSCTPEAVRVPGRNGGEQTVTVTRCY